AHRWTPARGRRRPASEPERIDTPGAQPVSQGRLPGPEGEHDIVLTHPPWRPALPVLLCQALECTIDGRHLLVFREGLLGPSLGGLKALRHTWGRGQMRLSM